nr:hypothetical protein [uncultured Brevundimonas sp.]
MVPLTATYDVSPEILLVEGEIILRSPNGDACYTLQAARDLAERLANVIAEAEAASD